MPPRCTALAAVAALSTTLLLTFSPTLDARATTASRVPADGGDARTVAPTTDAVPAATVDVCTRAARSGGFDAGDAVVAVAVGIGESTCNPAALHTNSDGSRDRGLWQINSRWHPDVSDACAFDARCNATVAYRLSGGGADWSPWAAYTGGAYTRYLADARASVQRVYTATPAAGTTPGVRRGDPATGLGTFLARLSSTSGPADLTATFGRASDVPLVGDWDGDGDDSPGLFRRDPAGGIFYLRMRTTTGVADVVVRYGRASDTPLVGDWDGDGRDGIGVRRGATFHLRDSVTSGPADVVATYGTTGDVPLVGDWDGNRTDTVGVRRGATFLLRNSNTPGPAQVGATYGVAGDTPIVGDWDGNRTDTVGVRRDATFLLRNSNTAGPAQVGVSFGMPGDVPLAGHWGG